MSYMIALYYCYPPGGIRPDRLKPHVAFHQETCSALALGGRVRASEEGVNGVLSGTEENLREYERHLRRELAALASDEGPNLEAECDAGVFDEGGEDPTAEWLDVKYCHLRRDVPVEKQLFESLSVKITREVVSLIEPVVDNNKCGKVKGRPRCRQRRKQRRKEKRRLESFRQRDGNIIAEGEKGTNIGEREVNETTNAENHAGAVCSSLEKELESVHIEMGEGGRAACANNHNGAANELGTALPIRDWEKRTPAVHLSPREWNEELLRLSRRGKHGERENDASGSLGRATPDVTSESSDLGARDIPGGEEAVLLDTRNVYESRVGHFAVPNLETFFPNTRKFSSLPNALNTEEAARALAGKRVFMYCTGGVRCERAGSYLRALSESNSGAWKGKEQPKGIYQLRGGIQKYLESFGREQEKSAKAKKTDVETECTLGWDDVEENSTTINDFPTDTPCLYRGKNFVFDPRRTDPMIGNGITNDDGAGDGGRISHVGRCVVCSAPHDDYDNGHAPCEGGEARCRRCRVLVLVCDGCRRRVRCWGESECGGDDEDGQGDAGVLKMELFCGNGGRECIDEGNVAGRVETARF